MEQLDLEEVVARAAGDFNGDEGDDMDGRRDTDNDDNNEDESVVENGDESKQGDENEMSVVQALASGVEVAPSEDGKVSFNDTCN